MINPVAHLDPMLGDNWRKRRLWMKLILIWMLVNAEYVIVFGDDNALMQNALVTLLGAITAILGSYVFGAVWDDREKRKSIATAEIIDQLPTGETP